MKAVGLFNADARIYFVNEDFAVMNNPCNGGKPVLVKRKYGVPTKKDWDQIAKILTSLNMELTDERFTREDGLWCCGVLERR